MSQLKNVHTEDLLERWSSLIDAYLSDVAKLREDIIKVDKVRNELLLIREELVLRNVDVEKDKEV